MHKGTVSFLARIKGNGLKFPSFVFNPSEQHVERVEIEGPNGNEICSTVYVLSVESRDQGRAVTIRVNRAALDRIGCNHSIAIGEARIMSTEFSLLQPQRGGLSLEPGELRLTGQPVRMVRDITSARSKAELEMASPPGEWNYALLRSARQSSSHVEEFMHLYHILLMLHDDNQTNVDAFILNADPGVPHSQHPRKVVGIKETVFSRLRNEFAHKRPNVNLERTKAEMEERLGALVALTKRAIELKVE